MEVGWGAGGGNITPESILVLFHFVLPFTELILMYAHFGIFQHTVLGVVSSLY